MKHYDIGVVGWWHNSNYGSILTYYALHQTLKKMGYSVLMIHEALGLNGRAKWNTSNAPHVFARKHYEFDEQVPYSELQKYNEVCDTFIAGSDQLWNPYIPRVNSDCFLDFTTDDKKRIAYATSFGDEGVLGTRPKFIEKNRDLLRRFHAVSVREEYAVKLAERFFGVRAVRVTDPVFLPDMEEYTKLADNATDKIEGEYLLAFILDPTEQKKQVIKRIAEKLGYTKVFVLTDPYQSRVELADKVFAEPLFSKYELKQISPENFLSAYRNASYVVTDSFHGTCFSYLFRKNFNVFYNIQRGAGRFVSILSAMKLEHRRVYEDSRTEPDLSPVNFTEAEKNIGELRDFSLSWLKNALETPVDRIPSILIEKYLKISKCVTTQLNEKNCAGCGACVSSCPKDALSLKPDVWGYYRASVEEDKCINCGLCAKVCPALNLPEKKNNPQPDCYAFIAKNEEVLESSSSGGAFPLLAREAFRRNGAVAGAAWRDDLYVEHIVIDDEKDLPKLQKSKYLQSYLGTTDREVKRRLDAGQFVLFSGCPCQVTGLKKYLGKDYENLILVDLFCGHSPSAGFFQKYLKDSFPNGVKDYQFRYKKQGWNSDCVTLTLTLTDGTKIERRGGKQDDYQKLYHPHTMCAPHCEHCPYQALPRFGDITIGDFWGYAKHDSSIDVSRGLSVVLCNNEKGRAFFESLPESEIGVKKKVPLEWIGGNGYAYTGHNYCSPYRDRFYESIKTKSFSAAMNDALNQGKTLEDYKNEAQWNLNAMNFFSELCLDNMGERKFERFMQSLAGKKIAVLKVQDRAGKIFLRACENVGTKVVFTSRSSNLDGLTEAEFAACKKADAVITCCVHGTKTHERDGVKCIDIWDILRDNSLTKDLPVVREASSKTLVAIASEARRAKEICENIENELKTNRAS